MGADTSQKGLDASVLRILEGRWIVVSKVFVERSRTEVTAATQSSMPLSDPAPEPDPAPDILTLIVGSRAIISASMSMTGFGTVLS